MCFCLAPFSTGNQSTICFTCDADLPMKSPFDFGRLGLFSDEYAAPADVVLGLISPIDHAASAEVGSRIDYPRPPNPSMVLLVTSTRNIPTNSGGEAHAPLQQWTGTFSRCWG